MLYKCLISRVDKEAIEIIKKHVPKLPLSLGRLEFKLPKGDPVDHAYFGYSQESQRPQVIFYRCNDDADPIALEETIINTEFSIKIKRKNSYLISLIHERFEESHHKNKRKIQDIYFFDKFYSADSHIFSINLELFVLRKLIGEAKNKNDREDFIRRRGARINDLKTLRIR